MRHIPMAAFLTLILQPVSVWGTVWETGETAAGDLGEESRQTPRILLPSYEVVVEDSISYIPLLSTVTAKLPAPLQATPASVEVVTAPLFESQNATLLGQALNNVSGVVAHSGFGVFDYFTIRGFDSLSSALVLTDGAPEPQSTYYQLYNVERIEVLKGPGGFLYGGNPLAGSINLVRKQPLAENALQLSGSFGSFETYRGGLDLNRVTSDGKLAFRLNMFGQDSNHYRDDSEHRQFGVNPAVTWHVGERTSLTTDLEYLSLKYQPDVGLPLVGNRVADVPRTRSYQSPFDFSDQEMYRFRVDVNTFLSDSVTLRNKTYFTRLDWRADGTLFGGTFPNQSGRLEVNRVLTQLDDSQTLFGNQFEGVFLFDTGRINHTLLTGFEVTRLGDRFDLDAAFLPGIDLDAPVEPAAGPLFPIPGQWEVGDVRSWVFAPFFVNQMSLSTRWEVFLGGRLDILDYEEGLSAVSRDDRRFSPLVGFSYRPRPDFSLYANAGSAFAPPSTRVIGEREPEESRQYEVGLKKQLYEGRLQGTLALYHLDRTNIAIPDNLGVLRQTGSQRSRGVEAKVAGEPRPGWYILASYAFTDSELTEFRELFINPFDPFSPVVLDRSGNRPAFAPRHLFKFWTLREFPGGWGIGGGGRFVGPQFIAEDNAFSVDRYVVFDAMASYRVNNWRWSVNLRNLTDRNYYTRGFGSTSVLPASPFGVYARVDLLL
jgi:iron complex outermembrane recepter protein